MKTALTCFAFSILFFAFDAVAQEADTTWVQTYTWEAQNNPETAYDSPGRRWFDFPASDNDSTYQKILMYYNLKCFEDGTAGNLGYACGEWDYLSYSYLFDHTGELDSNLLTHPHWLIDDLIFESDTMILEPDGGVPMDTVRWMYPEFSMEEEGASAQVADSEGASDWSELDWLSNGGAGGKMQWLWTAEELAAWGWENVEVAGLEFPALSELQMRDAAQWSAHWVEADTLNGFLFGTPAASAKVFDAVHPGRFIWDAPLAWDGTSHLAITCVWSGETGSADWSAIEGTSAPQKTWQAGTAGTYVSFDGNDRLEVAMDWIDSIQNEVTVEFWQRGQRCVSTRKQQHLRGNQCR